jgi:uncharacterized lipoprotein YajG
MKHRHALVAAMTAACFLLSGCGAMSTAIKKRDLDVKTQMSETIWLEPTSEKTVFIQVRNTSDKDMSGLQSQIASELTAKGYRVTPSSDTAYFWVQASVLKAEKMDLRQSQGFLSSGYEGGQPQRHWGRVLPPITPGLRVPRSASDWLRVWSVWPQMQWLRT